MTPQQKLDFVHKQTKLALEHVQHFDSGGTVLSGPSAVGTNNATNPNTSGIAGTVGNVLGTNNNFQATGANIQQGTNAGQLNQAYTGAQGALNQASGQSGVLNNQLNQGANSQNTLTNELTEESQGKGAAQQAAQSALNQNTGQNIAQQAALAASTRGAGANAGLIAQNAANTGANLQQTAVGQEATNQANNALTAQNQLQNLASTQVNQGTAATQLANQTQQNEQNILQNANTAANNAAVSQQSNINSVNAQVASGNQQANQNVLGGIGSAVGSIGSALALAEGGKVPKHISHVMNIYHPHFAVGGSVEPWQNSVSSPGTIQMTAAPSIPSQSGNPITSASNPISKLSNGVGSLLKPASSSSNSNSEIGEYIPVEGEYDDEAFAKGGKAKNFKKGGDVQGKPKVNHDDYSNDTVNAKLSPGEVVMDLNTLKDKGKLGKMARFVAKEIERKKAGRKLA